MLLLGFLIFMFVGIPIGIGFLCYFIPKRLGYPKVAKYATTVYGVVLICILFFTVFNDQLFSGNDAKELVEEQGFELRGEFELTHNESMSGIGDYYHTFTLHISSADQSRIIDAIKRSDNFKTVGEPIVDLYFDTEDRYNGPERIQNYETENAFVREYLKPNGDGYAPTYRKITVYKDKEELVFEDIDY